MGALHAFTPETANPLDVIERLAERCDWLLERSTDSEVNFVVSGGWSDVFVSLNWRDDLESLHVACTFDTKVPPARKPEIGRLFTLVNGQLFHGHFDVWDSDGSIVYRNTLVLTGGAVANDAQCETLIRLGLDYCQRYFPAVQYVCWAGKSAGDALESSMFETVGEA
jgi:hypothetical protein